MCSNGYNALYLLLGVVQGSFSQTDTQCSPSIPHFPMYCWTKQFGSRSSLIISLKDAYFLLLGSGMERRYQFLKNHAFHVYVTNPKIYFFTYPLWVHTHTSNLGAQDDQDGVQCTEQPPGGTAEQPSPWLTKELSLLPFCVHKTSPVS